MTHRYDFTGEKHGMLTAIEDVGYAKNGKRMWRCQCDCGQTTIIPSARFGLTLSCGCMQRSAVGTINELKAVRTYSQSLTYKSWASMLGRCRNPNAPNFHLYGGRGIKVCLEWQGPGGFYQFALDMGQRPKGATLDRINNDGNYEPGNCRWATAKEQRANQRDNPGLEAHRRAALDRGRERMWADPEIRARLLESRRKPRG